MSDRKCATPNCRNTPLAGERFCYSCEVKRMEAERQEQTDLHKWTPDEVAKREG